MRRSLWLRVKDPFTVLGLTRSASKAEVKTRYRELARLHHPDAGTGDSAKMEQINKAYNLLLKEGVYERLRLKPAGAKARDDPRRPNPFSQDQQGEQEKKRGGAEEEVLTDEEVAKVSALDPATERVVPGGKYMYQSRDDGSWVELDRPLVHAHQPRYASFAAQAEMSAELRRRSMEREREENAKTLFQRTVDRMSDSADLPTRNPTLLRLYFVLAGVVFYLMYQRAFMWGKHRRGRASFYSTVEQQRQELLSVYEEHRDGLEASVAAAAVVFLAASEHKQEADPIVPPTPEKYFKGVQPPREHFHVVSGG
ncbi:putative DNA-J protein [Trypanosoma grayi]|uniref:putative DNA-J protein n=1 Tax=Trypanosoma grayi TaxID=71804 RepID=UPI0004F44A44|nr:putative DNA-J protein [Trypanosoma grayi]KEG15628.1 putative DNA-J protein [Trypanosoma grayi]